jgi:hypothetical protein
MISFCTQRRQRDSELSKILYLHADGTVKLNVEAQASKVAEKRSCWSWHGLWHL